MRVYKTAVTKPIPLEARYSTRKGVRYVTCTIKGKKVTAPVTDNNTMRIGSSYWSLKFRDNNDVLRYMRAYRNERASRDLSENIVDLLETGQEFDMPEQIRKKLKEFGIIGTKPTDLSLGEMINKYGDWLRTTRVKRHGMLRCKEYCNDAIKMIRKTVDACKFYQWQDIKKAAFEMFLSSMKVKSRTYNNYLVAFKGFCIWAVENDLADKNPVAGCKGISAEDKEKRRALSPCEFNRLLDATKKAPRRFELTGQERAVMYILATETGLRKSELISLTVSSFDFEKGVITLGRENTKNRHTAELPLKQQRVHQLREFISGKFPNVKLFSVTSSLRAGDMIHKDLKDAGIPVETDEGVCCFHSLRHTYSANLNKTNAKWLEHKTLMRHSLKGEITANYTNVSIERQREIIEQLPNFKWPVQAKKAAG